MVTEPRWVNAFPASELADIRVFVQGHQRIAVFRVRGAGDVEGDEADQILAVDDRCPHEGYPLSKGFVNGCVLTCRWHAFRFDLRSGQCLVGDEPVRSYPVRRVGAMIELDLAEPSAEALRARYRASLDGALERRRLGQMARDVVRLIDAGATPFDVAMIAVRFDAERAPSGTTHVPALAHDLLARLEVIRARHGAEGEVAALVQVLDLAAEASLSYPSRVRPAPATTAGSAMTVTFAALRAAVEAEEADLAEALVRTAIATGQPIAEWIRGLVSDHLLDIGHGFIFPPKVLALVERSPADADLVLGALVRRIAHGRREELVPEWSWVTRALNAARSPDEEGSRGNLGPYIRALLDGTRQALFETLEVVLASRDYDAIVDALVIAASVRVLRYDLQIETDPSVQEGWLDVTHGLTMASALRHYGAMDAGTRRRILYFASAFVHLRVGLDAPLDLRVLSKDEEHTLFAASASEPAFVSLPEVDALEQAQAALERREADRLVRLAEGLYIADRAGLVAMLEDWCLMRPAVRAIFATHQWKVLVCGDLESRYLAGSADPFVARAAHLPLIAAARFVGAPLTERAPLQAAHEAVRFVRDFRVPRRRT